MKRKTKPNKAAKLRQQYAFNTGVEAAKRTISTHMQRRYWWKGFAVGVAVSAIVVNCAWVWVSV